MRGRSGRGRGGLNRGGANRVFVPHIPFDLIMSDQAFPRVKPVPNDDAFTQVINLLSMYLFISTL